MAKRQVWLCWSSGKDSAWALPVLRERPEIEVSALLVTVNATYQRVAMHAVRVALLEKQAAAVGLPLKIVLIPNPCSNAEYETVMAESMKEARNAGVDAVAFGDLFLEDVRAYRQERLAGTGIQPLFPLWGIPTDRLCHEMLEAGLRAMVTCVDPRRLSGDFAGREYDAAFLADLPKSVDPCGEHGEFHSFAFDGPMFTHPLKVAVGETVEREGFVFADLCDATDPKMA